MSGLRLRRGPCQVAWTLHWMQSCLPLWTCHLISVLLLAWRPLAMHGCCSLAAAATVQKASQTPH